ncbi:MAG: methyltransferase domain-containing protein [Acidobacteria bacterium]|nr:methyltransferase domain-containing protein [Acidobacteriota bacterium]
MADAYDLVPYPSVPYAQAHADRLAVMAILHGLSPAPVERCRVLELGCGEGGHLIPMAFSLPQSEFVGVDRAADAIAAGQTLCGELGLGNIALRALDLEKFPPDLGQFDYIITHGLYAWAPPAVQDKILAISKAHLAPRGVAYVSYNALPGGHVRLMLREMMRFHLRGVEAPAERIGQAQVLLQWLAAAQREGNPYGEMLKTEARRALERRGQFLYHDELTEVYAPVYFHDFMEHAARHGLQYLAEASLTELQPREFPQQVLDKLEELASDPVLRGQYLDFLRCRKFRQTLLCHQEAELDPAWKPDRITRLWAASAAEAAPAEGAAGAEEFRTPQGAAMSTAHPVARAALRSLVEVWPCSLSFAELLDRVRQRSGLPSRAEDAGALAEILYWSAAAGLVELHAHPPRCAARAGELPVASPLVRLQLRQGLEVSTLRHTTVKMEGALERELLLLMDGTRDRTALLAALSAFAESMDPQSRPRVGAESLEHALAKLARLVLLLA